MCMVRVGKEEKGILYDCTIFHTFYRTRSGGAAAMRKMPSVQMLIEKLLIKITRKSLSQQHKYSLKCVSSFFHVSSARFTFFCKFYLLIG